MRKCLKIKGALWSELAKTLVVTVEILLLIPIFVFLGGPSRKLAPLLRRGRRRCIALAV